MKYYSKGPNFARNLVHHGAIEMVTRAVSPVQLFNFLLSHEKLYGMSVIRMEPVIIDTSTEMDNEYVLIKISQHRVSFKDHQEARRTDDFDVSLILSYDSCSIGKSEKEKVRIMKTVSDDIRIQSSCSGHVEDEVPCTKPQLGHPNQGHACVTYKELSSKQVHA